MRDKTMSLSKVSLLRLRVAHDIAREQIKRQRFYSYTLEYILRAMSLNEIVEKIVKGATVSDEDYSSLAEKELKEYIR